MTLKTPWTLIDPTDDGSGILARIVTDREMGHVAVFESPETARATVETMNHAESLEQELEELDRELAETRAKLEASERNAASLASIIGQIRNGDRCTPAERAVLDAWADVPLATLKCWAKQGPIAAAKAELARRGEKQ